MLNNSAESFTQIPAKGFIFFQIQNITYTYEHCKKSQNYIWSHTVRIYDCFDKSLNHRNNPFPIVGCRNTFPYLDASQLCWLNLVILKPFATFFKPIVNDT